MDRPITGWRDTRRTLFFPLRSFENSSLRRLHKYRPDFIIRLKTGNYLVLETKGQDKAKRAFDAPEATEAEPWTRISSIGWPGSRVGQPRAACYSQPKVSAAAYRNGVF
jgi:hypothetical protein